MIASQTVESFAFPASFAQERLWLLAQMEPGDPAYHIAGAVRFKGNLNISALRQSLNAIVRRQESLRTTFKAVDGEVIQFVSPADEIQLELVPAPATDTELLEELSRLSQKPFDLEAGPLLRVVLLKRGADDHTLLLTIHHIISDGWSLMVLIRELMEFYRAFVHE